MIEYVERMSRLMIRENRDKIFVFGDNVARRGYGGQAAAARGEPNAFGIATKWQPDMQESSFFRDDNLPAWEYLYADLYALDLILAKDTTVVVVPNAGIGTGLSKMQIYAPRMLQKINRTLFPTREGELP